MVLCLGEYSSTFFDPHFERIKLIQNCVLLSLGWGSFAPFLPAYFVCSPGIPWLSARHRDPQSEFYGAAEMSRQSFGCTVPTMRWFVAAITTSRTIITFIKTIEFPVRSADEWSCGQLCLVLFHCWECFINSTLHFYFVAGSVKKITLLGFPAISKAIVTTKTSWQISFLSVIFLGWTKVVLHWSWKPGLLCPSVPPTFLPSFPQPVCPSVCLSVTLSVCPSFTPCQCSSVPLLSPSVCPSICPSVCSSVHPSLPPTSPLKQTPKQTSGWSWSWVESQECGLLWVTMARKITLHLQLQQIMCWHNHIAGLFVYTVAVNFLSFVQLQADTTHYFAVLQEANETLFEGKTPNYSSVAFLTIFQKNITLIFEFLEQEKGWFARNCDWRILLSKFHALWRPSSKATQFDTWFSHFQKEHSGSNTMILKLCEFPLLFFFHCQRKLHLACYPSASHANEQTEPLKSCVEWHIKSWQKEQKKPRKMQQDPKLLQTEISMDKRAFAWQWKRTQTDILFHSTCSFLWNWRRGLHTVLQIGHLRNIWQYGDCWNVVVIFTFLTDLLSLLCATSFAVQHYNCRQSGQQLTAIPDNIPEDCGTVDLSRNQISEIDHNAFSPSVSWLVLRLQANSLSSVDAEDFNGLGSLTELYLSHNSISTIEPNSFSDLTQCRWLFLDRNSLSGVQPEMFNGLSSVQRLNLEGNQISTIAPNTFANLPQLNNLDLSGNSLTEVNSSDFVGLSSLRTLSLSENSISAIEPNSFSDLSNCRNLYLNENALSELKSEMFIGLSNIKLLFLPGNQITKIEANAFSELSTCYMLSLGSNSLSEIEVGAFNGLDGLYQLDLEDNNMSTLEPNIFSSLSQCEIILFQSNPISDIKPGAFNGLGNTKDLRLSENRLIEIEGNMWQGLSSLTRLVLEKGELTSLADGAFAPLGNLEFLYLEGNKIREVRGGIWEGLGSLKTLQIQNNLIQEIPQHAFSHLPSLQSLSISENSINAMANGAFQSLTELQELLLRNNKLTEIGSEIFVGLQEIQKLDFQHNQIASISSGAFADLNNLVEVWLGNNNITTMSAAVFSTGSGLYVKNHPALQDYGTFDKNISTNTEKCLQIKLFWKYFSQRWCFSVEFCSPLFNEEGVCWSLETGTNADSFSNGDKQCTRTGAE